LSLPDPFPRPQPPPPELAEALAHAADRLRAVGRDVRWYAQLTSTNDLAARLAECGSPEGVVVVADAQTAGRGRHGRSWCSPAGAGLYISVILRPPPRATSLLTITAGVALVEGIGAATGLLAALKWPNDVYLERRKVAGILAEAAPSHVVLGVGVNVSRAAYPADVSQTATSLESELGRAVDRGTLLVECLAAFEARYDDVRSDRRGTVVDAWRAYARPLLGRRVEWDAHDGLRRGVAEDLDDSGALLVRTHNGTVRVISGEVRWI
jgi:BirA family transcriptional regulator, biotin operon repressor / biotin---[acetyl-CoA-carboxylase] ligase